MMQLTNELYKFKVENLTKCPEWQFALESLVQLVAPFAPHTAEELWHDLGHEDSVNKDHWPIFDISLAKADNVKLAVQVNGKLKGVIEVAEGSSQEDAVTAAKELKALEGVDLNQAQKGNFCSE